MQPALTWEFDPKSSHDHSVEGRLIGRAVTENSEQIVDLIEINATSFMLSEDDEISSLSTSSDDPYVSVIVIVFAHPDSGPAQQLKGDRSYFDTRTGESWDVFFPGYLRYGQATEADETKFDDYWSFSPRSFNEFRINLEKKTNDKWKYSGGSELVILTAIVINGEVTVDFDSVLFGQLTDPKNQNKTLSLAEVIENISRDLEDVSEDDYYGVGTVVNPRTNANAPQSGGILENETIRAWVIGITVGALLQVFPIFR